MLGTYVVVGVVVVVVVLVVLQWMSKRKAKHVWMRSLRRARGTSGSRWAGAG